MKLYLPVEKLELQQLSGPFLVFLSEFFFWGGGGQAIKQSLYNDTFIHKTFLTCVIF